MEKIKNCFYSPVTNFVGRDLSDDLVIETEYVDKVIMGPSGEPTDFVVEKVPVETNRYHLGKVIQQRAKGCDLESIVARCNKTGDMSLLNAREVSYGDSTLIPDNASDMYQKGIETSEYLDSLSKEEKELYIKLAKMDEKELKSYLDSLKENNVVEEKEENK
jgi:hypothetical protein